MKRLLFGIIFILLILAPSRAPQAKVTGVCSNCHTMHNSQGGQAMAYNFNGTSFSTTTTPKGNLLIYDCLGCHTGTNDGTNTTPYVYSIGAPTYGSNTLAGGNFYWVKTDDTKGHNVFSDNPDSLTKAPGDPGRSTCKTNSCHANLHGTTSGSPLPELDGRQGCTKCHLFVAHHANDGTGTKYVDSAAQGWYRFLAAHGGGSGPSGGGVKGIEHEKWNYGATASSHNEYFGIHDVWKTYALGLSSDIGGTMTAYCCGCHGNFHIQDTTDVGASPWIRHPSDAVIPITGEYGGYTTYDPLVPVARPSGFNWSGGPSSSVNTGGTLSEDLVMCLSCHVAHGSPYYKMMRWDNKANMSGCVVCHTSKN